mmetsp:Transcript_62466/g.110154  ORF Transcript_62466/g.110154 Transcript_62466/m.110154 type:complete len:358 (-) Transcript_62466:582-1655(-)
MRQFLVPVLRGVGAARLEQLDDLFDHAVANACVLAAVPGLRGVLGAGKGRRALLLLLLLGNRGNTAGNNVHVHLRRVLTLLLLMHRQLHLLRVVLLLGVVYLHTWLGLLREHLSHLSRGLLGHSLAISLPLHRSLPRHAALQVVLHWRCLVGVVIIAIDTIVLHAVRWQRLQGRSARDTWQQIALWPHLHPLLRVLHLRSVAAVGVHAVRGHHHLSRNLSLSLSEIGLRDLWLALTRTQQLVLLLWHGHLLRRRGERVRRGEEARQRHVLLRLAHTVVVWRGAQHRGPVVGGQTGAAGRRQQLLGRMHHTLRLHRHERLRGCEVVRLHVLRVGAGAVGQQRALHGQVHVAHRHMTPL